MTPPRPEALEVRPRHIPDGLKAVAGWILWKYALVNGKWTKPPFNEDGKKIDAHNPTEWMTFAQAVQAYQKGGFDGIGLSLNAMEGLVGVDLDHCVKDGKIEPWALEIIEELGSYVEISPSGEGLRVLGYGKLRREGRKKGNVEVYDGGRYLTFTGHKLDRSAVDLMDFDEALDRVHRRTWPETPTTPSPHNAEGETGSDLAERFAALCEDDPKFKDKYYSPANIGDRSDHEFHLCARLWEEGFSESEIRSLMDSSPQEKWRERDDAYKEGTIREAVRRAIASERGRGRGEISTEKAKDFLETVKEGLKADPKKLQDPDVLREMATLQKGSPVAFEVLMDEIGIKTDMKTALKKELKLVAALKRTENTADDGHGSALATTVGIVRSALETDPMSRFCYDQVGQPFLYLDAKGRHIPMALDSREFGIWATKTAMALYGIPLARKTIKEADLSIMAVGEEVMARKGLDLRVHMAPRVNVINGSLWYDLGTEDMMGVEVNGQKAAIKPLPLGLVRHPTDLPQVMPDLDASPLEVWKLMDFMPGVQMEDFLFLVAWAVASFLPCWEADGGTRINLPLPLAGFIGPKGSTKTITARFLQKLLDPDAQESQNMPDTPRDMGIVLHNNRAVLFDNITRVHEWQSNALCGGATGGSNTNRKLRTDSEVVVHDYNARTMFTSVIKPEFESDAADRILYFYTRALPPHLKKPEALLFQEFEEVKPRILGAIFNTLQKVMAIYPEVLEESKSWANQVRMADFCVLGECCARIWGFEPGLLRDAYTQTLIGDSGQMVLDDNVVLALRNWVWTSLVLKEGGHWEGLVSELKEALERDLRSIPQDWPAKPNRFSNRLRKAQEDLSRAGISIDFKLSKHGTVVVIDAVGSSPLEAGGDTELITTTITTRINAIRKAIGGDGGGGGDKYRDNNRKDIDNSTPPLEGRGGSPRGSGQNSDHKGEHTPESITTTTTITTTEAADGDLEGGDGVVISSQEGGDDHHPDDNLSALLTREKEMDAEDAERKKTPEPKDRDPTSEEAEVLEVLAGRILENWPGLPEMLLWEKARGKLGSPLPLAAVKAWLKESGYTEAGRLNGSPLWNPPVGVIS